MEGFAQNATRQVKTSAMTETVMNGFKPELVPVYRELVKEFAVCDRWFASVPSPTQSNRLYVHSTTSHGLTTQDVKKLIVGLPQNCRGTLEMELMGEEWCEQRGKGRK
ncbi:Phosphoesterase [Sesbania bispinosa]|nr:Phosphoesterase [Sesbania bispinosa]KAJ1382896.1 Phosphoesterase [Sesbania bispinosa]